MAAGRRNRPRAAPVGQCSLHNFKFADPPMWGVIVEELWVADPMGGTAGR